MDSRAHSSILYRNDHEPESTEALFVHMCITGKVSGASAMILCIETFWNSEVRVLIKAGSTDGLVRS